jgi:hypothetical protein
MANRVPLEQMTVDSMPLITLLTTLHLPFQHPKRSRCDCMEKSDLRLFGGLDEGTKHHNLNLVVLGQVTSMTGPSISFRLADVVLHPMAGAMAYVPIM